MIERIYFRKTRGETPRLRRCDALIASMGVFLGFSLFAAPTNLSPSTDAANPVALLTPTQKDYLSKTIDERCTIAASGKQATLFCFGSPVELKWEGTTGECSVSVKRLVDGKVVWTGTSTTKSVEVVNLEVGAGYEWTVTCGGESARATFYTENLPPRLIKTGDMKNLRDLGGWPATLNGKTCKVRQNLIFRGGAADDPKSATKPYLITDDSDRDFFYNVVGLKNEVDLRDLNNTSDVTAAAKESGRYKFDPTDEHVTYNNFSIKNNELANNPNFAGVLKLLTNPEKLPAYFHCKSGRDRTGTTAAVLLAVLGVSYDNIVCDYQTTSDKDNFNKTTEYNTYYGGFKNFLENKLGAYKNANLSLAENASAYLQDCGITAEEIETFRETMLEGYVEEEPPPPVVEIPEITEVTAADLLPYTGAVQTPQLTVMAGELVVSSDNYEVSAWSPSEPKDAGTYTATVTAKEGADVKGSKTVSVKIEKATLTVKPVNMSVQSGDAVPAYEWICDGYVGGETKDTVAITGQPVLSCNYTTESAGDQTYEIRVTDVGMLSAANYTFVASQEPATLTVTPAPVEPPPVEPPPVDPPPVDPPPVDPPPGDQPAVFSSAVAAPAVYTGKAITPKLTVKVGDTVISRRHYKTGQWIRTSETPVGSKVRQDVGEYETTVTSIDDNFTGEVPVTFKIISDQP